MPVSQVLDRRSDERLITVDARRGTHGHVQAARNSDTRWSGDRDNGVRVAVSWSDARRPGLDRDELAPEHCALIDRYG